MKLENKRKALKEFINKLKQVGFKVYGPKDLTTYCYFVQDNNIGYVQSDDFGFCFTTVHKPCRSCGTGLSMYRDDIPTIKKAKDCFIMYPSWAISYHKDIKKYKNWEEFKNHPSNVWQEYIEL